MRLKFIVVLLLSLVSAWLLAEGILSYLNPMYVSMEVKHPQSLQSFFLSSSKDEQFRHASRKIISIDKVDKWQTVRVFIPAHRASHLRLGLFFSQFPIYFKNIQFNGHPIDLMESYQYKTRNIRSCEQLQTGETGCLTAGHEGYITFSPQQISPALSPIPLWEQIVCFAICFVGCFLLYRRNIPRIFSLLQNNYPTWLLSLLFMAVVYTYYATRIQAFLPRLHAIFLTPAWSDFLLFFQEHIWAPALLLLCTWGAFVIKNKSLKFFVLVLGVALLLLESIDCALLYLFSARFSPEQISVFGPDIFSTAWPFIKSYLSSTAGIYNIILIVVCLMLTIFSWRYVLQINLKKAVWVFAIMGFIWYLIPSALEPAEKLQLRGWPRLVLRKIYSSKNDNQNIADFDLTYQCQDGLNSQQNIIIILIESLSSYMSHYFSNGKAENWTPNLDKLAHKYIPFTNYRTTNPDTAQALFSILTGFPAIHYYAEQSLYREPKFYYQNMAKIFRHHGYHTAFFTSASLVYSKDIILEKINFDETSISTDPFYNGKKRFVFNSVSDDILYNHAQEWIESYNKQKPYLLLLETTTSHNPFIDPVSGEESLEKTIRYADKALGNFIKSLEQQHLLDNTLVVITSDHRVMQPLDKTQIQIFKDKAEASIPFVIIGSPLKNKQIIEASHIDLLPSLAYLTTQQACFHPYQHNIFSSQTARTSCTMFQSFIEPETVLVECQGKRAKLCLNSQNNFICDGSLPEDTTKNLLSFINWIRDNNRY